MMVLRVLVKLFVAMLYVSANVIPPKCDSFPSAMGVLNCCNAPQLIPETSWVNCARTPDSIKVEKPTEFPDCPGDCIFRELGLIKNEELDYDAIRSWLESAVQEKEAWHGPIDRTIENCTGIVENTAVGDSSSYPCKTKADFYLHCLQYKSMINCPEQEWVKGSSCALTRGVLDSCRHPDIVAAPFRP